MKLWQKNSWLHLGQLMKIMQTLFSHTGLRKGRDKKCYFFQINNQYKKVCRHMAWSVRPENGKNIVERPIYDYIGLSTSKKRIEEPHPDHGGSSPKLPLCLFRFLEIWPSVQTGSKRELEARHDKAGPLQMVLLQAWHREQRRQLIRVTQHGSPINVASHRSPFTSGAPGSNLSKMPISQFSGGSH